MDKKQTDFRRTKIIIVVIVAVFVAAAGWRTWRQTRDQTSHIDSFESCVAAGNPVMESYPEQCAANGQTFTNPSQR